jgi:hypothetical protein
MVTDAARDHAVDHGNWRPTELIDQLRTDPSARGRTGDHGRAEVMCSRTVPQAPQRVLSTACGTASRDGTTRAKRRVGPRTATAIRAATTAPRTTTAPNISAPATTTAHTRRCRNPPRTPILTGRQSRTSQFRRERQGRPGTGSPAYQLIGVLSAALWMRENGLSSGYPAQSWCGRARISVWGSGAADRNYGLVLRARESDSSTLQAPPDGAW